MEPRAGYAGATYEDDAGDRAVEL
eukprot:COSAG02_NODE_46522_length_348_cov_0.767068_1_plen_23_part_10